MAFPSSPASRPAAGTDGSHSQRSVAEQMKDSVSKAFQRFLKQPTASLVGEKADVSSKPRSPDGPQGQGRSEGHNQYIAATGGKRFEEINIPGDGNCLFAAVDKATGRSGDAGTRALLAKHLSDNRDRLTSDREFQTQLRNCVLDACGAESKGDQPKSGLGLDDLVADVCRRNLDGYVRATNEGHPWEGQQGDLTARLLASHLKRPIHIYRPDKATIDLSGKYEPLTKEGQSAKPIRLYGDDAGYWKLTVSAGVPQTAQRLKKLKVDDITLSSPGGSPTDLLTAVDFAVKGSAENLDPEALRRGVANFVDRHRWALPLNETFQKEFLAALPESVQRGATGAFLDKYIAYVGTDRTWSGSLADLNIQHLSDIVARPIIVYADGPDDPKAGGSQPPQLVERVRYQPDPIGGTAAPAEEPIYLSFRSRHYNLLKPAPAVPTPPPISDADDGLPDPQQAILRSLRSMSVVFKTILQALDNILRLLDGGGAGPNEGNSASDVTDGGPTSLQLRRAPSLEATDRSRPPSRGAGDASGPDKSVLQDEVPNYWRHEVRAGSSPEGDGFSFWPDGKLPGQRLGEGRPQFQQLGWPAVSELGRPTRTADPSVMSGGLFGGPQHGRQMDDDGTTWGPPDNPNDGRGRGGEDGSAPRSLLTLVHQRQQDKAVGNKDPQGQPERAGPLAELRTDDDISLRASSPFPAPETDGALGGVAPAAVRSETPPDGLRDDDDLHQDSALYDTRPFNQAPNASHLSTMLASSRSVDGSQSGQPNQPDQPVDPDDLIKALQHAGATLSQVFDELCDVTAGTANAAMAAAGGGGSAARPNVSSMLEEIGRAIAGLCQSLHQARDGEATGPAAGRSGGPADGKAGWSEAAAADEVEELYRDTQTVLHTLSTLQARLANLERHDLDEHRRKQIVDELDALVGLVRSYVQADDAERGGGSDGEDDSTRTPTGTAGAREGLRPDEPGPARPRGHFGPVE